MPVSLRRPNDMTRPKQNDTRQLDVLASGLMFDVDVAGVPGSEPVLLLHGFPQTSHTWRHELPALAAQGFFAIAPNQRGYSPHARRLSRSAQGTVAG